VKTTGWLVIVLKRHAESLHELTTEEFAELAQIQAKLMHFLYEELYVRRNMSHAMQSRNTFITSIFMSLPNRLVCQMN